MQSFFGKINFVRKFTPDFAETIKPLQRMIHKDAEFKWDEEKKGLSITSKLPSPKHQCYEALISTNIFSFIPLLLTNPWLQYLLKRMMKTMKHNILYEHQPPRS
jgi:hypothetical protein